MIAKVLDWLGFGSHRGDHHGHDHDHAPGHIVWADANVCLGSF